MNEQAEFEKLLILAGNQVKQADKKYKKTLRKQKQKLKRPKGNP